MSAITFILNTKRLGNKELREKGNRDDSVSTGLNESIVQLLLGLSKTNKKAPP